MGLVLIGGTILLVGLVWKQVSASTSKASRPLAAICEHVDVSMGGYGEVISQRIEADTAQLIFQQDDGNVHFVTVDLCSGDQTHSLLVHLDAPE